MAKRKKKNQHRHKAPQGRWHIGLDDTGKPVLAKWRKNAARYDYAPGTFDLSQYQTQAGFQELADQLRALAYKKPSRPKFLQVCDLIAQAYLADSSATVDILIPYATEHTEGWPAKLRQAPLGWVLRLIRYALPVEALQMVSALSLSPAMTDDFVQGCNDNYPLLIHWFRTLPEDVAALDGLSIDLNSDGDIRNRLQQLDAQTPDENLRPRNPRMHVAYAPRYYDEEDIQMIVASPLCRQLRHLELCWYLMEEPRKSDRLGRGMSLGALLVHLASQQLESLNITSLWTSANAKLALHLGDRVAKVMSTLKELNVGNSVPMTDAELAQLVTLCPQLQALDIRGYQEWENEWDQPIPPLSAEGMQAFHNMTHLQRLNIDTDAPLHALPEHLQINQGSVADWETYFTL